MNSKGEAEDPGPSQYEEQISVVNPEDEGYPDDGTITYTEEVIYEDAVDEDININDVDVEEIVDDTEKWTIPMGQAPGLKPASPMQKRRSNRPSIVLRTVDDLRLRPRVDVRPGRIPVDEWDELEDRAANEMLDETEEPTTSVMPSIRPVLRMYADAALKKADRVQLLEIEDEEYPGQIETEVEEDRDEAVAERDPSKRTQTVFSHKQWPLYWDHPVDFQEACEILCGTMVVDDKLVCSTVPQIYKNEGSFVIDLRPMVNRHSVHVDGMGSWGKPTGRVRYYTRSKTEPGRLVRADDGKGRLLPETKYVWKCMMKRYEHPMTAQINDGANRFIKKCYTALYPTDQNKAVGLAIVTYEWLGREPFDFPIVGNLARPLRRQHGRAPPSTSWENSSFQNNVAALPSTISRFFGDIPMYAVGAVDFNTAASIILGGTMVEQSKIAHQVPQGYREAGTFVIDIEGFPTDAYLRRDNNGIWGKPAGTSRYYVIDEGSGDAIRIDSNNKLPTDHSYDIQILCKRYEHPMVEGRFIRKIYTARGAGGVREFQQRVHLALLVYYWKGEPEYFETTRQNQINAIDDRRFMEGDFEAMDIPSSPRPRQPAAPSAKRIKTDSSLKNGLPMEITDSASEKAFRNAAWKKEYENQMRFSALLDRADAFLCRLERASGNVLYTQDNSEGQQEWVQRSNGEEVAEQVQYNECE